MSSMGRAAFILPILLACSASASAQIPSTVLTDIASAAAAVGGNVNSSIGEWRRLRQGGNLSFANYAHFLNYNDGWPGEAAMRTAAEKAMQPGENASLVLGFYRLDKPKSGNGWARYSDALAASGRAAEALDAAKKAWASDDLTTVDEASILARYGASLTPQDHNARVDALLFGKDPTDAARLLAWTSTDRRSAFAARIAMQQRAADAETLFRAASHRIGADAGLLMDRLRYLHDGGNDNLARQLAAQKHQFTERPADPERWYEMLLILANGAADDRQWHYAYNIARQLDDAFAPGTAIADQS
jgi:soluble lytic murein transglycosylase